ncbi:MAG: hypothetical protein WDO19_22595 [Bacteroidota bacterium]
MKVIQLIQPVILLIFSIACANRNDKETTGNISIENGITPVPVATADTFETGKVVPAILCKANPDQSYALYIPAGNHRGALPVIYFFDPHGDGALPVTRYKSLADLYGFILIGSNNSKNGNNWPTAENIWTILSGDSKKRLQINVSRIYTCGFSGGAKVAGYIAMNHPEVKGVIAGGAALPDGTPPGNFRFSFTAIAGEGDMNMTDIAAFSAALDKTQTRHRIIFFDGIHEWAPVHTMDIAFAGLQLDAMGEKLVPRNDTLISNYIAGSKKRIADYTKANNYIKADAECRVSISLLGELTGAADWFNQKEASIKSNPVYQNQLQSRQHLLATEQNLKEQYMRQFQQGDMNYWNTTIRDLQAKANPATGEGAMYQRLVAYLSLAFYSISNQLIVQHRDKEAQYFVELYKADDVKNPEAWYFSAILQARSGNATAAKDDLLKAVTNGFTDKIRMRQQQEFQNLPFNLAEIESKMKK